MPNWNILVVPKAYSCDDSVLMLYLNVSVIALTWCITPITGAKSPSTSAIFVAFAFVLFAKLFTDYIYITAPSSAAIPVNYVIVITG